MYQKKLWVMAGMLSLMSSTVFANPIIPSSWTGIYNDEQKISLFFKQNGSKLTGKSILDGKEFPFVGAIKPNGEITLKEQGSGNSVGVFEFRYIKNKNSMEGSWKSANGQVKPKFFTVDAQACQNARGEGNFPDVSVRLLKDADLQVPLGQLQYMRNEIYARHGYAFANKGWASTFAYHEWYMPCYLNVENRLTSIEKQNIQRIKMVEPYAKDVEWGR